MFLQRELTGDGAIVARVASPAGGHPLAKAGLMVRDSLDDTATFVSVLALPDGDVVFQYRDVAGAPSVSSPPVPALPALWLKLVREGHRLSAYRSADGEAWQHVGTAAVQLSHTLHAGLAVTSAHQHAPASAAFTNVSVSVAQSTATWSSVNIGTHGAEGSTSELAESLIVKNASGGLGGVSDDFRYAYRQVSGDIDVIARIVSVQDANNLGRAGLMIRSTLASDTPHAAVLVTAKGRVHFERRRYTNTRAVESGDRRGAAPIWVKLERRGTLIEAFSSPDGKSWTSVGRDTVQMPQSFFVGVAASSHSVNTLGTAVVEQITIAGTSSNAPPQVTLSVASTTVDEGAAVTLTANASDADGSITAVDFLVNGTKVGSDSTSPFSLTVTAAAAGTYQLVAIAHDDQGASAQSSPVTLTVQKPPPPPPPSPSQYRVAFTSLDHASLVNSYVIEIFNAGATPSSASPVLTSGIGKGTLSGGDVVIDVTNLVTTLPSGTYIATVTAVGTAGSARSNASPVFTR